MNTFLPYKGFATSAACLDNKRLGKQRVEAWQIYLALTRDDYGWKNHPAVKMWRGYEGKLLEYGNAICTEWVLRGYNDSMLPRFLSQVIHHPALVQWREPVWLTDGFCNAHRSNLLRKDSVWYSQFNWNVPNDLPYIWPVK